VVSLTAMRPGAIALPLTNLILLAAGGLGPTAARGLALAARGLAEGAGISGERAAIERATQEAESTMLARGGRGEFKFRPAGRKAAAQTQVAYQNRRVDFVEKFLDGAGKAGAPLPPGAKEIVPHLMRYGVHYRYLILARLARLNAALQARGRTAQIAAGAIRRLIKGASR